MEINNEQNYEKNWIKIAAISLFFLGLLDILSALFSFDYPRLKFLNKIIDYQIIQGSRSLEVITGVASLIVAPALYRQKRIAWYIAIVLLGLSGFAHILKGADIEEASICLVLMGVLLPLYKYCKVKSDPIRLMNGSWILLGTIVFVFLYTCFGLYIFSDKLGINSAHPIWSTVIDALMFNVSNLKPAGIEAKFYVDSLLLINSFAYITGLIFALSPVIARRLPDINYDKYNKITKQNSSQPVQFFTLSNNYQHFYYNENNTEGLISYKVSHRVALAIGNPCANGPIKEITSKWLSMAYEHDWTPAFYQAQDELLDIMKEKGFQAVPIGVEAIVKLSEFSLEGKKSQNLRTAKNKAVKEGWKLKNYDYYDWNKVKNLDNKWLSIHGKKENDFAMGKSTPEYLDQTKTTLLFDKDENLLGYINNIDLIQTNTRSVDLMRRDPDAPQGVMEYLFLNEILSAKDDGYEYYDLGFSPLAKADEAFSDNKIVTNLFKLIFEKQKKYYDFQGLHRFKSKFNPEWKQSYLLYPNTLELPKVLMALLDLNKKS